MGANGQITIWRDDKVRAAFPDCDNLFVCLPTHYCHELNDIKYHHCYSGDNMFCYWWDQNDWYVFQETDGRKRKKLVRQLKEFVKWLEVNSETTWEVWT